MSRIIVEKELNKKTPQNQSQTSYIKVVYESSIPSNNQNLPPLSSEIGKNNSISNPISISQFTLQDNPQSLHQVQHHNSNENQHQQITTPIIHVSPFTQIQPLPYSKNVIPEPNYYPSTNYDSSCNILGTEMTAQEADDLFDSAEKMVGWSYWKINE